MSDRPIIVTKHAIEVYRRRMNDNRPYPVVMKEIERCVAAGLEAGLVFRRRPPGFVLYRRKTAEMPPGQRFVQCHSDADYGFILKRKTDEGDVVVTMVTRAGVRW